MEYKFCPNCGFKLNGDFKFCPACGFNFSSKTISENNNNIENLDNCFLIKLKTMKMKKSN